MLNMLQFNIYIYTGYAAQCKQFFLNYNFFHSVMFISMRKIDDSDIFEDLIHTPESSLLLSVIVKALSNGPIISISLFVPDSTIQTCAVHLVNLLPPPKYLMPIQCLELLLLNISNMTITSPNISDFSDNTFYRYSSKLSIRCISSKMQVDKNPHAFSQPHL